MTITLTLSPHNPDPELIRQASEIILRRGLVAFPTETVYGLGANALDEEAVANDHVFAVRFVPQHHRVVIPHFVPRDRREHVVQHVVLLAEWEKDLAFQPAAFVHAAIREVSVVRVIAMMGDLTQEKHCRIDREHRHHPK